MVAQQVKNPTSIHKNAGLILGLVQWVNDLALPQAWGIVHRCGLDLVLPRQREELIPILGKWCHKTAEEATCSNSFHEATITLIPQSDKDTKKKKKKEEKKNNVVNITDEHRCKNPQKGSSHCVSAGYEPAVQLVSMRMWVWSLPGLAQWALPSGLKIQHCHELWCRSQLRLRSCAAVAVTGSCSSDSIPSLGTSTCRR